MDEQLRDALARIEALEARLAETDARSAAAPRTNDDAAIPRTALSRRFILGALGAGAAGAALSIAPRPAAAAPGAALVLGQDNDAGTATTSLVAITTEPTLDVRGDEGTAISGSSGNGTAISGSGNVGSGVVGYSSGAPGVDGHSDGNWGVLGNGGLGGVHGECYFTRTVGELATETAGVNGRGPIGVDATGVADPDAPIPATGPTVGVKAAGDTAIVATGPTALRTTGRLEFSRSGIAWVPVRAAYVDVTVPDCDTAPLSGMSSKVLATAMGPGATVAYASVRSQTKIRITLARTATAVTRVAWMVIG